MSSTRIEILVELVIDGRSEGALPFISTTSTAKEAIQEFLQDEETIEELEVDPSAMTQRRIEKFSRKYDTFLRIKGSTNVEEADHIRVILTQVPATTSALAAATLTVPVNQEDRSALADCSNGQLPMPRKRRSGEEALEESTLKVTVTKTALMEAYK